MSEHKTCSPTPLSESRFSSESIKAARKKCYLARNGRVFAGLFALAILLLCGFLGRVGLNPQWPEPLAAPTPSLVTGAAAVGAISLYLSAFAYKCAFDGITPGFSRVNETFVIADGRLLYVWWPLNYTRRYRQGNRWARVAVADLSHCSVCDDGYILTIAGTGLYGAKVRGWSCYEPDAREALVNYVYGGGALKPARKPLTIAYPWSVSLGEQTASMCGTPVQNQGYGVAK